MKKIIAAAALFLMSLSFGDKLSAGNFGVLGGASFYSANLKEINTKAVTQWHAGLAYKLNLPLGFHVQPAAGSRSLHRHSAGDYFPGLFPIQQIHRTGDR